MKPDSVCGLIFSMVSVPFGYFLREVCAGMARCVSDGPFFSVLPEKNGEKRGAGDAESRFAPDKQVAALYVFSLHKP